MSERTNTVWADTRRQSGTYECAVARCGEKGVLTVELVGGIETSPWRHLLHRESVNFTEPDPDKWRTRCEEVISNPDKRDVEGRVW